MWFTTDGAVYNTFATDDAGSQLTMLISVAYAHGSWRHSEEAVCRRCAVLVGLRRISGISIPLINQRKAQRMTTWLAILGAVFYLLF